LRTFSGDSFSHFLLQSFFTELEQKYGTWLETTYRLTHVSFQKVNFQKCRYEAYWDSYRTWSAQAFSSHSTT
jgi:hypothetical protein